MPDISLPQANTQVYKSFVNLNGTSDPFVLPYGFYFLTFRVADTNVYTTVTVNDLVNVGNVLAIANIPMTSSNIGSGAMFQTLGAGPINIVTSGPTLEVTVEG